VEGRTVWLQLLVMEVVQVGLQVVTEGADSAGPDPIGPAYFETDRGGRMFATVAPRQVGRARKRLIFAGAVLPLGSAPGSVLLFPLRPFYAGSAVHCLVQLAAL
jgi:hypothetical protein